MDSIYARVAKLVPEVMRVEVGMGDADHFPSVNWVCVDGDQYVVIETDVFRKEIEDEADALWRDLTYEPYRRRTDIADFRESILETVWVKKMVDHLRAGIDGKKSVKMGNWSEVGCPKCGSKHVRVLENAWYSCFKCQHIYNPLDMPKQDIAAPDEDFSLVYTIGLLEQEINDTQADHEMLLNQMFERLMSVRNKLYALRFKNSQRGIPFNAMPKSTLRTKRDE